VSASRPRPVGPIPVACRPCISGPAARFSPVPRPRDPVRAPELRPCRGGCPRPRRHGAFWNFAHRWLLDTLKLRPSGSAGRSPRGAHPSRVRGWGDERRLLGRGAALSSLGESAIGTPTPAPRRSGTRSRVGLEFHEWDAVGRQAARGASAVPTGAVRHVRRAVALRFRGLRSAPDSQDPPDGAVDGPPEAGRFRTPCLRDPEPPVSPSRVDGGGVSRGRRRRPGPPHGRSPRCCRRHRPRR
jgi:hypothetical protein